MIQNNLYIQTQKFIDSIRKVGMNSALSYLGGHLLFYEINISEILGFLFFKFQKQV